MKKYYVSCLYHGRKKYLAGLTSCFAFVEKKKAWKYSHDNAYQVKDMMSKANTNLKFKIEEVC